MGYRLVDGVRVFPGRPGIDEVLASFARCHTHSEAEVRLILDGQGYFTLEPDSRDPLVLHVVPGDFVSILVGFAHSLTLGTDRRISFVRIFTTPAGLAAHACDEPAAKPAQKR